MKVRLSLTGTAPLLMHNVRLADPLDPLARAMKAISSKRTKTEADHEELARLEFAGGLYIDDVIGPYIPGQNIERSLNEAAKITKAGKKVERGVFVMDDTIALAYAGPRTVEGLWGNEAFRSVLAVKIGTSRIMRTRPMFREWGLDADIELDPTVLALEELERIAEAAGSTTGLGDYRPRFGRFTCELAAL